MPEAVTEEIPSFSQLAAGIDAAAAKGESFEIKPTELMGSKPAAKAAPEAAKEQPKPEAKSREKPAEKTPEKKVEVADDDPEKMPEFKNANSKLRAELKRMYGERNEFKTKAAEADSIKAKVTEYEAKIKALESKPVETKADTALIEKYEKEIKESKQRIRELDYQQSDDFRENYVKPMAKTYRAAVEEVVQLTVTEGETNRAATQADFDTLRNLPLAQRRANARAMFGQDADLVLGHIRDIEKLQKAGNEAIENEKVNGETRRKEEALKSERERGEYENYLKTFHDEITNEYAHIFKPGEDDKEAAEALRKGFEFVDAALKGTAGMTMKERAAYSAVLRAKVAGFDAHGLKVARLEEQNKSLLEELKKFRDSDPGTGGGKPPGEKPKEEEISINAFSSKFNNMD